MTREKFKKNDIFSMKKIVGSTLDLSTKADFLIGQIPIDHIKTACLVTGGGGGGGGERCRNAQNTLF